MHISTTNNDIEYNSFFEIYVDTINSIKKCRCVWTNHYNIVNLLEKNYMFLHEKPNKKDLVKY